MFYWPVRVYYEDTDSGGVVYYANYLKFMERARTEWMRNLGFEQDVLSERDGIIFAVRAAQLDFLRPGRFNDLLYVSVEAHSRRAASLSFIQQVLRPQEGAAPGTIDAEEAEVLCGGEVQVACLDVKTLRPRRIPRYLLTEIEREH